MASTEEDFTRMLLETFADDPATGYYQQFTDGSYDVSTGENTTVMTETPCRIILEDLTRNSNGLSSAFGTDILAGDKNCYLYPPEKVNPLLTHLVVNTNGDKLRIGSTAYKIINMKSTDPTGSNPILYQLMLRK